MECPCGDYAVKDELTKHAPFNMYESNYVDFAPAGMQDAGITCSSCKYKVEGNIYKSMGEYEPEISVIHCHVLNSYITPTGLCRFWTSRTQLLSQEAETKQQEDIRLELEIAYVMEKVSEDKKVYA